MTYYLLAVHSGAGAHDDAPPPDRGSAPPSMEAIVAIENEMRQRGAFVFTGALTDAGSATVVRSVDGGTLGMTDGPYAEAKEQIAGFYVIDVPDLDAALEWAGKVVACIGAPIEVRPFHHGVR